MSIQFVCPACQQPIEVDSEHGGKQVGSPYCRRVVTAPMESSLLTGPVPTAGVAASAPPAAAPAPPCGGFEQPSTPAPPLPPAWTAGPQGPWSGHPQTGVAGFPLGAGRNTPGIVGIICGVLAVLLMFGTASVVAAHFKELGVHPDGKVSQAEMQERMMEMMKNVERHPWLMKIMFLFFGAIVCWVVGLTCSIVGMSRRYRSRTPAVIGLISTLVPVLLMCVGTGAR
jgi:hypothetical protein